MSQDQIYQKDWNKSLQKSIAIHVLLLLLAFLLRPEINPEEKIEAQYAVTVSFQQVEFKNSTSSNSNKSKSSEGAQRAKSEAPKKLETPKPSTVPVPKPTPPKPTPQPTATDVTPTDPVISETTTEESDIQAVEQPMDIDDPEPEYIPQENTDPVPVDEPVILNPELPTLDDIIGDITDDPIESEQEASAPSKEQGTGDSKSTSNGTSGKDPSLKDGDGGSGKGDSGTGKGKDADGNDGDSGMGDGGAGEGEFDASGDGIFGRKVIYRDPSMIRMVSDKSGKIVFKVCINRRGIVSYLEIDELKTTIKDNDVLRNGLESMRKYKYEVDYSAAKEQCGTFTVTVDNYKGVRSGSF
jgi:outer membrane biosynthesis protein TonB